MGEKKSEEKRDGDMEENEKRENVLSEVGVERNISIFKKDEGLRSSLLLLHYIFFVFSCLFPIICCKFLLTAPQVPL